MRIGERLIVIALDDLNAARPVQTLQRRKMRAAELRVVRLPAEPDMDHSPAYLRGAIIDLVLRARPARRRAALARTGHIPKLTPPDAPGVPATCPMERLNHGAAGYSRRSPAAAELGRHSYRGRGLCPHKEEVEISQTSHRLMGPHWTRAARQDLRWTLTCGYGLPGTGWTSGTDLRIRRRLSRHRLNTADC